MIFFDVSPFVTIFGLYLGTPTWIFFSSVFTFNYCIMDIANNRLSHISTGLRCPWPHQQMGGRVSR